MTGLQASVVTLTFSADDIRFVSKRFVNFITLFLSFLYNNVIFCRSPGRIVSAFVEEFEALSKNGIMKVVVVNNGSINAEFEVLF